DVGQGIDAQVIHDVAGVVVDLDSLIGYFADDLGPGGAGAGFAAVLLHDNADIVITGDGTQFLEALDPQRAVGPLGVAERQYLGNAGRGSLRDAVLEDLHGLGVLRVN